MRKNRKDPKTAATLKAQYRKSTDDKVKLLLPAEEYQRYLAWRVRNP